MKKLLLMFLVAGSSLLLSGCGKKPAVTNLTPTPAAVELELTADQRPVISLIPRLDGHELKLTISKIPSQITDMEYELIYSASDNGLEMEKGLGDTIKIDAPLIERKLLLGTESCTNGCKYKYDAGVTGGTLKLSFLNSSGQSLVYETPFTLKSGKDLKKENNTISLKVEDYSQKVASPKTNAYYVLLKSFGILQTDDNGYSLFDSSAY